MTIQNTTIRKAGPSLGNGINTLFPFTFKVFVTTDVLVTYLNSVSAQSSLVLGSDYSISLNADQNAAPGGVVTLLWAPAAATYITLTSQVANTQNLALTNSGGFYPQSVNDALDRVVIQVQQLAEQMSRTFQISVSSIGSPGAYISDYLAQAALSATTAAAYALAAKNSVASVSALSVSCTSSGSAAALSATAAANSAISATAPSAIALANYIDLFFPSSKAVTFTSIYVSGGWDMGNISQATFTNESTSRCINLASDATASFNFGTVP